MNNEIINFLGKDLSLLVRDEADRSVIGEIFKFREYRVAEEHIKKTRLPIIDVGAHAGFFSIYARVLNSEVKIIAVEPDSNNLKGLNINIENNKISDIFILSGAVSARTGRRHLFIAKDSHNHHLQKDTPSKKEHTVVVDTWSLSDILKKCIINTAGLVKMDIEGGEFEIIKSLDEVVFSKIECFIIEYHDGAYGKHKEIENILRVNGFGVRIFPSQFDKKMGFIFALNKRIK